MKYEGSTDPHEHLRDFEHRMDPSRPSSRILVANSNTMFGNAFDALGFKDGVLKTHQPSVMGNARKTTMAKFVVLQDLTAYNVILCRKTTNDLSGVIYTKFLVMKYETDARTFETLHGDREVAKPAADINLALQKKSLEAMRIFFADLDVKVEE
ncbi:hypothetical protein PIB30_005333 [Stylosanthes scabra]|uniref:Uncharacterized protein n=1 Tax=Stylosanthes scabra TaxID=79078 RepID=A0ABU6V613_9FABA|nr:hypothetical protein [Stylosanthes scabra]